MGVIRNLSNKILAYLRNVENYSNLRFIFEITLVGIFLQVLFGVAVAALTGDLSEDNDEYFRDFRGLLLSLLVVTIFPAIETIVGQFLPIWIVSFFTKNTLVLIIASTAIFTGLHVIPSSMLSAWPHAVILAWSFVLKSKKSKWEAIWVVTAMHSLRNSIAVLAQYIDLGNVS